MKHVVMERELHKLHGDWGLLDGPLLASSMCLGSVGPYNGLTGIFSQKIFPGQQHKWASPLWKWYLLAFEKAFCTSGLSTCAWLGEGRDCVTHTCLWFAFDTMIELHDSCGNYETQWFPTFGGMGRFCDSIPLVKIAPWPWETWWPGECDRGEGEWWGFGISELSAQRREENGLDTWWARMAGSNFFWQVGPH